MAGLQFAYCVQHAVDEEDEVWCMTDKLTEEQCRYVFENTFPTDHLMVNRKLWEDAERFRSFMLERFGRAPDMPKDMPNHALLSCKVCGVELDPMSAAGYQFHRRISEIERLQEECRQKFGRVPEVPDDMTELLEEYSALAEAICMACSSAGKPPEPLLLQ